MARADRLERLESQREEAEAEYRDALIAALRVTAAGQWGLFDHQQDRHARAKAAPMVAQLDELADTVNDLREKLGMEEFALHAEFWPRAARCALTLWASRRRRRPGWLNWGLTPTPNPNG
jgi:hypothetical protein